jgi:hypothetical protein
MPSAPPAPLDSLSLESRPELIDPPAQIGEQVSQDLPPAALTAFICVDTPDEGTKIKDFKNLFKNNMDST